MRGMQSEREITNESRVADGSFVRPCAIALAAFCRVISSGGRAGLKWVRNYKCKFLEKAEESCFSYFSRNRDGNSAMCRFARENCGLHPIDSEGRLTPQALRPR